MSGRARAPRRRPGAPGDLAADGRMRGVCACAPLGPCRSAYFPVRDVVDGEMCSQFAQMPAAKQKAVAAELERSTGEVLKKLEDVRNKIL